MASLGLSDIKGAVDQILETLETNPQKWRDNLSTAMSLITLLDMSTQGNYNFTKEEQLWIIEALNRFAFVEPDTGGVMDIANWCLRQTLELLRREPNKVAALQLVAENWLLRAQPNLARIHLLDASSSSSGGSGSMPPNPRTSSAEESRLAPAAATGIDERIHTADYVEARGILLPATEYFTQAVESAEKQGTLKGGLLIKAAEAFMSLGNVSSSRTNEQYFRQAIQYLRNASQIPDYALPSYLQQYLEDYTDIID